MHNTPIVTTWFDTLPALLTFLGFGVNTPGVVSTFGGTFIPLFAIVGMLLLGKWFLVWAFGWLRILTSLRRDPLARVKRANRRQRSPFGKHS